MEIKRVDAKWGNMMYKLKGLMDKAWMDGCGNQRVDAKGAI